MAFAKYLLPTLAIAGAALAQSECTGSLIIQSTADAAAIQGCQTYHGNITIADTAAGAIAINGVQQLTGNLNCANATQLTEISSDQLNSIGGTWYLNGLTILSTLQFSSLTQVHAIDWIALPALQALNFDQGVQSADTVYISNTQLNSLSGIELQKVGYMDVNNNRYLSTVNVNDLTNVTGALSFSANAPGLQISFPNLESAANLTFKNVSAVTMPSLSVVQGAMGFYSDLITEFMAPNLTVTGGGIAFVDSPNLNKISMPMLQDIGGGFLIANNTDLLSITGFPKLQVIVGALDFAGAFTKIDLPSLKDVRGGSNVQSSGDQDICTEFDNYSASGVIKGVNTCIYNKANPDTNPSATSGGTSSTSTSTNAASLYDPSAPLTGLSALIAALLFL